MPQSSRTILTLPASTAQRVLSADPLARSATLCAPQGTSNPKITIITRGVMGLQPAQGDEKRPPSSNRSPWKLRPPLVIPTDANPDFLPRSTGQSRVCAFLLKKGA